MVSDTNAIDLLLAHWRVAAIAFVVCFGISLCLIARLWVRERHDTTLRKFAWSLVLVVPIFGWLFFAAFYHAPRRSANEGHVEYGQAAQGDGGFASGHSSSD
jgi:uncharacterized membrane protein YhaH (DUF805 family)